ncbi:MAG: PKD domain-containing protein [Ferruginibacter sp.]
MLLQLTQPITTFGTYVVHNKIGTNGNGIIDTCSAAQSTAETISFAPSVQPSAIFTSQVKFSCVMDTVTLFHPGGNGVNSWIWTFADGTTDTGQKVIHLFPVSTVTTTITLTVANVNCSGTSSQTITLDNAFKAAFTQSAKDTSCINTTVTFKDASIGKNIQYLWLFGDNTQFAGQNPPPHSYTVSNTYDPKLILSDLYGCIDSATTTLTITPAASVDFTGIFPVNCTDKVITLTRNVSPNIYDVAWDNGNGITFGNKTIVHLVMPSKVIM